MAKRSERSKLLSKRRAIVKAAKAKSPVFKIDDLDPRDYLSTSRYEIKTVAGLVDALGGELELAIILDIASSKIVHGWVVEGKIPTGWHLLLLGLVCGLGKTVAPSAFGFNANCDLNAARGLAKFMIPQELARLAAFRGGANV